MALLDCAIDLLEDFDGGLGWVVEADIFELDFSFDVLKLLSFEIVNSGDMVK